MSKTWIAKCVSFKGKHPDGEVTHRVVVKAQYKKDGIEAAQKELKLFDVDHHDKYKKPELTEVMDESEAERFYIEYMAVREQLEQVDLCDDESNFTDESSEETGETLVDSGEQFTAEKATVAEYPIIEPYSVRIAVAKQGESFVHSMAVVNREKGGNMYGQLDVFNPKKFSSIENAVVYGLAMSIDAVNKYLPHFLDAKKVEVCVIILSGYAQDAEGNFIERFMGDHDLSNATFMAVSQPKEESEQSSSKEVTSDVTRITAAVVGHPSIAPHMEADNRAKEVYYQIQENFTALHNKYGLLPAAQMVEHIISMSDASDLITIEGCDELASHYVGNTTTHTMQAITESDDEEIVVQYYAGQQWAHYIEEIMGQFDAPVPPLLGADKDAAAKNIGKVFNDWKIALFIEKDKYTEDADIFKDEVYLHFESDDAKGALEMLKSYHRTQSALCDVLADSFQDLTQQLPNPKVGLELNNLAERLVVDTTLNCPWDSTTIKALMYSELQANAVQDETILNPKAKMEWWFNLSADFEKQQAERIVQDSVTQALNEKVQEVVEMPQAGDPYAMAIGSPEELREKADEMDRNAAGAADNLARPFNTDVEITDEEYSALLSPEDVPEPEITPDDIPAKPMGILYGEQLLKGHIDSPYELAIAYMLQKFGVENYRNAGWYQNAAANLREAVERLKGELPALMTGLTVEKLVREKSWASVEELEQALDDLETIKTELWTHGVFDYDEEVLFGTDHQQEAPADEPEETRQDIELDNDDPVTSADNGDSVATDNELSVREIFKRQMAAANQKLGLVGIAWGYEIKRQWTEDKKDGRTDCHVEVGIWFKGKNGTKGEPISFYGVSNANFGNYVNDAMMLALVNGLDITLISLGVEVEG